MSSCLVCLLYSKEELGPESGLVWCTTNNNHPTRSVDVREMPSTHYTLSQDISSVCVIIMIELGQLQEDLLFFVKAIVCICAFQFEYFYLSRLENMSMAFSIVS